MADQDKILLFLGSNGPSLPTKIAKALNIEILFASAHLSDLKAQGKINISNLKIGGSPLYYLLGQEHQLYKFASGNMNPKDLEVLNRLKERKVLREAELDLLSKVALRSLHDFAIPLHVTLNGKKELFWKWHLISKEETNKIIGEMINPAVEKEELIAPMMAPALAIPETRPEVKTPAEPLLEKRMETVSPTMPEVKKELSSPSTVQVTLTALPERKGEVSGTSEKRINIPKIKERAAHKKKEDEFFPVIGDLFKKLKIAVEQQEVIRKNAELNLVVKVPSAVGQMTYFCKAKQKNRCDEKDLSAAYMEAQIKKLPLLFLYTGELTKKAQDMLQSEAFQNVIVKKVE